MSQNVDELTLVKGGKHYQEDKEHSFSGTVARTAGGLYLTNSQQGIGIVWPQILGVIPYGADTLAIVASFCLITLHGFGVATLTRLILDRRISELREGGEYEGARIDRITIEGSLPKLGNQL